jgi:hypothetical protein
MPKGVRRASQLPRYRGDSASGDEAAEASSRGEGLFAEAGGGVIELVGTARLTAAVRWTAGAQGRGEAVVWVSAREDGVYPPDLERNGVDLDSLPVVSVREREECIEAIDTLMRSGFFSLLVVDWNDEWSLEGALQTRFLRLGRHHGVTLLFIGKENGGNGIALVPLRIRATRRREAPGAYLIDMELIRDKRGVRMTRQEEAAHGPPGLR